MLSEDSEAQIGRGPLGTLVHIDAKPRSCAAARSRFWVMWAGLAWLALVAPACRRTPARVEVPAPQLVLWAWDRGEDLQFLTKQPPASTGVAYLAATVYLYRQNVVARRRTAALVIPDGIWRMPVVRIETDRQFLPTLEDGQRQELLRLLRVEFEHAGLSRLQIDFEATASQRAFYRGLIFELRAALGSRVFLSVTALASWCLQDRFMTDWPVDEIVPMFYRLGSEGPKLRNELLRGVDLAPECRRAHGLYTDEPMILPPAPRRLYLFSRAAFSEASLDRTRGKLAEPKQDTR